MANPPLRVVQYGLGPIGAECARTVLARPDGSGLDLVGAIDIDPDKAGKDLGQVVGTGSTTGIVVSADVGSVLAAAKPHVALHTTTSFLDGISDQLDTCIRAGVNVVSSTEELLFPYDRHPRLSARLDEQARAHGVTVLGTGVNPGYVMDSLALMATGVCREVRRLDVERVVDAAQRRLPLQRKVGAGLTPAEFDERKRAGAFGHIGLVESALLVADGLGWPLDRVDERLEPVIAPADVETPFLRVTAGHVAGIHHTVRGHRGESEVLSLDLRMYVGAEDPRDAIRVDGDPPIDLLVRGGVFGDTATVATLVNAVPLVVAAAPGLVTVKDLPLPRAFTFARSGTSPGN